MVIKSRKIGDYIDLHDGYNPIPRNKSGKLIKFIGGKYELWFQRPVRTIFISNHNLYGDGSQWFPLGDLDKDLDSNLKINQSDIIEIDEDSRQLSIIRSNDYEKFIEFHYSNKLVLEDDIHNIRTGYLKPYKIVNIVITNENHIDEAEHILLNSRFGYSKVDKITYRADRYQLKTLTDRKIHYQILGERS